MKGSDHQEDEEEEEISSTSSDGGEEWEKSESLDTDRHHRVDSGATEQVTARSVNHSLNYTVEPSIGSYNSYNLFQ